MKYSNSKPPYSNDEEFYNYHIKCHEDNLSNFTILLIALVSVFPIHAPIRNGHLFTCGSINY